MAETSENPAPEATLRQKTREGETRFDFFPDRLDYVFAGKSGTRIERKIPWNVVPSRFQLRHSAQPDRWIPFIVRTALIVMVLFLSAQFAIPISPLLFMLGMVALMAAMTILVTRRFRIHHSLLPTSQGNIVILGDPGHDAILARLIEARRTFYRRFAVLDTAQSKRWNLQRLRWLFEQDVIDREEYIRAQQMVLPDVPEPLLHAKPETGNDLKIEQHFCNALFAFDFGVERLSYRRRTSHGVEVAFTVHYLDVAEPKTTVKIGSLSRLYRYVAIWLGLIGFGYVIEMIDRFQPAYFANQDGVQHILSVIAPGIAAVALAIAAARRLMRMSWTKLPGNIFILCNRQHDAIFEELKRRRIAALRSRAAPDPLLSATEQANVYAALGNLGIVDAADIPSLIERAAALQKHLGLADAEMDPDRKLPGEMPSPPASPNPTIH